MTSYQVLHRRLPCSPVTELPDFIPPVGVDCSLCGVWGAVSIYPQFFLQSLSLGSVGHDIPWLSGRVLSLPLLLLLSWLLEIKIIFQITLFRFSPIKLILMKCHKLKQLKQEIRFPQKNFRTPESMFFMGS